jgi:hypothetical protein
MEKSLYINPPSLLRWQPKGARNDIIFLDLEAHYPNDNTIDWDLSVVFRPILVKHGLLEKKYFYIGSTGARVGFEATDGQVKNFTRGTPFNVEHELSKTSSRGIKFKLSPALESGGVKGEMFEVTADRNNQDTSTKKFAGSELELTTTDLKHGVEWAYVPPPGRVTSDFIEGNLDLHVEASWKGNARSGTIEWRPSDVRLFDSERRIIGSKPYKAFLMLYILATGKEGWGVNSEPTKISFKEIK